MGVDVRAHVGVGGCVSQGYLPQFNCTYYSCMRVCLCEFMCAVCAVALGVPKTGVESPETTDIGIMNGHMSSGS